MSVDGEVVGLVEPVLELLSEDVVWHVPGTSPIAGDHQNRERRAVRPS